MPQYKLIYFTYRALAEATRYLFALGDVDYEDFRVTREDWLKLKSQMPFEHLPVLEVDGTRIAGTMAIARFVAKRIGIAGTDDVQEARIHSYALAMHDLIVQTMPLDKGEDKKLELRKRIKEGVLPTIFSKFEAILSGNPSGYLVDDELTWADVELLSLLEWLRVSDVAAMVDEDTAMYPNLLKHEHKIQNVPKIAAWRTKRPKTFY